MPKTSIYNPNPHQDLKMWNPKSGHLHDPKRRLYLENGFIKGRPTIKLHSVLRTVLEKYGVDGPDNLLAFEEDFIEMLEKHILLYDISLAGLGVLRLSNSRTPTWKRQNKIPSSFGIKMDLYTSDHFRHFSFLRNMRILYDNVMIKGKLTNGQLYKTGGLPYDKSTLGVNPHVWTNEGTFKNPD